MVEKREGCYGLGVGVEEEGGWRVQTLQWTCGDEGFLDQNRPLLMNTDELVSWCSRHDRGSGSLKTAKRSDEVLDSAE